MTRPTPLRQRRKSKLKIIILLLFTLGIGGAWFQKQVPLPKLTSLKKIETTSVTFSQKQISHLVKQANLVSYPLFCKKMNVGKRLFTALNLRQIPLVKMAVRLRSWR